MSTETKDITSPALAVRDLWAGYDGKPVLEAVSFEIDRGDMVGIIGPNGSGKSTLIKTVLGLVKPLRGEVSVLGTKGKSKMSRFFQVGKRCLHLTTQIHSTQPHRLCLAYR